MAIKFDFYKATGVFDGEEQWFVRSVQNGTVHTDALIERISAATTLTPHDLKATLSALAYEMKTNLNEGRNVSIEGIGCFSPSIGGVVKKDRNGVLRLNQAEIRSVNFRPEPSFMSALRGASFTSADHGGHKSSAIDEARLPETLAKLCEKEGQFTSADFREALHLTIPTANRLLKKLREQGVIRNIGSSRFGIYKVC